MTVNALLEKLKDWDIYDEQGNIRTLNLLDKPIEIPCEISDNKSTTSIIVAYDVDRDVVRLLPSMDDGRLE